MEELILSQTYVHDNEHQTSILESLEALKSDNSPRIKLLLACAEFCTKTACPPECKLMINLVKPPNCTRESVTIYEVDLSHSKDENLSKMFLMFEKPVLDGSDHNSFEKESQIPDFTSDYKLMMIFDNFDLVKQMFNIRVFNGRIIVTSPNKELETHYPDLYKMMDTSKMSYDGDMAGLTRHQGQLYYYRV